MNTKEVHIFKDKGMQTQYEVKFIHSVFSLNNVSCFKSCIWLNLYPSNGLEGSSQSIFGIWNVKDHGSHDLAWKPNIFF
jgi:hypothetical protein